MTLDEELTGQRGIFSVDFIKIDVQGYEYDVLLGAEQLIKNSSKNSKFVLEFEFDPNLIRKAGFEVSTLYELISSRLSLCIVNKNDLLSINKDTFLKIKEPCDLLGIPSKQIK